MNNVVQEPSWGRAQSIIFDRFGKNIEYKFMNILTKEQSESDTKTFVREDDYYIPIVYKNVRLGYVIVQRGGLLSFNQRKDIADLVEFILTPFVYNFYLKSIESQLNVIDASQSQLDGQMDGQLDNGPEQNAQVIQFVSRQQDEFGPENHNYGLAQLVSKFLHLKSTHSLQRKKVALKIHEMLENTFFLDYSQIKGSILSINDIEDLTDTTIYIEDVTELAAKDFTMLESFIARQDKYSIVVLVGSNLTDARIRTLNASESLKNDLMGLSFDINRIPVEMQTSEEVLDLMFFNNSELSN